MKLKVITGMMLTMFLIGMLALVFNIQPVKASGTIYIRADGSVDPPTANITRVDNVTYAFTDNINDSIVVERDSIVVDGAGYILQGWGGGTGISLLGRCNVTIKNMEIKEFSLSGVWLLYSSNISIVGNNITNNIPHGVWLMHSSNNSITGNNITNNESGICLEYSANNTISGNNITNSWQGGIYLVCSSDNSIVGNKFVGCGLSVVDSYFNVVFGNVVNGKPLVYLEGVSGHVVGEAGQVILVDCNDIVVEKLDLSDASIGLQLWRTHNSKITQNNITANEQYGIRLWNSSNNSIVGNNIVANNWCGILLEYSSGNMFFHNNFINNEVGGDGRPNKWDNGVEGNYWSDYNGTDLDQDGIGDTLYIIQENNTDNYPLMGMFSDFPISSIYDPLFKKYVELERTYHVTTISNSTIASFGLYPAIYIGTGEWVGGCIVLDVFGPEGTKGFCRFTIPKDLLDCPEGLEAWTIRLNFTDVTSSCKIWENLTHTFIYVPYNHSVQEIMVEGTWIVPEFPTWASMLLTLIVLTVAIAIYKRGLLKTPIG